MAQHASTRAQFSSLMGFDPRDIAFSGGSNDPVQNINWYHAIAFCNKLSIAENFTQAYAIEDVDFSTLRISDIRVLSANFLEKMSIM